MILYFFLGLILVTDAIAALGLPPGIHKLGTMDVKISEKDARILGTEILAGRFVPKSILNFANDKLDVNFT